MGCPECGMHLEDPGEFHPYSFCILKKAGQDPWEVVAGLSVVLEKMGPGPFNVRDIPTETLAWGGRAAARRARQSDEAQKGGSPQ